MITSIRKDSLIASVDSGQAVTSEEEFQFVMRYTQSQPRAEKPAIGRNMLCIKDKFEVDRLYDIEPEVMTYILQLETAIQKRDVLALSKLYPKRFPATMVAKDVLERFESPRQYIVVLNENKPFGSIKEAERWIAQTVTPSAYRIEATASTPPTPDLECVYLGDPYERANLDAHTPDAEAVARAHVIDIDLASGPNESVVMEYKSDPADHPAHYTQHPSGVECIQITEHMGFNLGNAVKYIWRADLKGAATQDLEKAVFYLQREIARKTTDRAHDQLGHYEQQSKLDSEEETHS